MVSLRASRGRAAASRNSALSFAVGKVLGHASYQSTRRYSHLSNDTLLAAVKAGAAKQQAAA